MILSKKHKFIFIKGKKVAGTSIEVLLSHLCGNQDIVTPITPIDERSRFHSSGTCAQNYACNPEEHHSFISLIKSNNDKELENILLPKGKYYNHMPLKEVLYLQKDISEDWLVFAAERDPYSKIISYANMQIKFNEYLNDGKPMLSDLKSLKHQIERNFDDGTYLDVKNIDLYKDPSNIIKTVIIKYDDLDNQLSEIISQLGIINHPPLKQYKAGLSSNKIDPFSIYTKKQLHQINETFEEEFLQFDFNFLE